MLKPRQLASHRRSGATRRLRATPNVTSRNKSLLDFHLRSAVSMEAAVDAAIFHWQDPQRPPVSSRFVNAYSLALATSDPDYGRLVAGPGWNFPDGRPVAPLYNALTGRRRFEQVKGPDFFETTLLRGSGTGLRHYLLGGTPGSLNALIASIRTLAPEAVIAGSYSPPFRPLTTAEMAAQDAELARCAPDIVWVGLGTPKQDIEAARITCQLGLNTAAVGAAFDFTSGQKHRAPDFISRVGLEWAFRLATEPRRLAGRYTWGNATFLRASLKALLSRSQASTAGNGDSAIESPYPGT